ncbi:FAD binding domain-containing protein [Blastococcus sp. PRF04-17]|uniref:FAD binding domain-containing protein n=1 Tax=Blastococcus sp. PRF04-17 TaxID=2933797 RepID=UPI001FF1D225|nr:FAD binding domain-containing protein [Blastococcus sp. PRF04-17]UOY02251.1 FAD binding domain-containing protein [Blastococcus sp. PRF04-17]
MALRFAQPAHLVDLNRVPELVGIRELADGGLSIGAMTRTADVAADALVSGYAPVLAEAAGMIGHAAIRNRGTIGGSVAHADPAAELPAVLVALDATLRIRGRAGQRDVRADEFFQGYFTTVLGESDILTDIVVPPSPVSTGSAFVEEARRVSDFAMAGAAAVVTLEAGRCTHARLVLMAVSDRPYRSQDTEAALLGSALTDDDIERAAGIAAAELTPNEDIHASADYRRALAAVVAGRALQLARDRATA